MYIEFKPGQKYAQKGAEVSETPDAFTDCGYLLNDMEVVIDIDHLTHGQIEKLIATFNIKTQVVWTDRGAHLYFRKPINFTRAKNGVCALGFKIETKNSKNTPKGVTIKRNGVLRKIDNADMRMELPWYFYYQKKFADMTGLEAGEGRNNLLFAHRGMLDNHSDTMKILRFINETLFSDPLDELEFDTLCRQYETTGGDEGKEYGVATALMNQFKCVVYQGKIWFWDGKKYVTDIRDDNRLKKMIYDRCPGKNTRFIDEVIKQIFYRAVAKEVEAYPIRLRNGIVFDGQFFEVGDYQEFTPYFIDIDYKADAEVVPIVDEYIDNITDGDSEYRKLLLEAMAYVMITDPETIRMIGQFFMFRGDGANGKGTLLQIMRKIYGPENCASLSIKDLTDTRYQVNLVGKLANLGDDIQPEAINNDQMKMLKNICTADTVSTRLLYQQSFDATFTAKLYFTTNSDLKTFEKGYAYKRRVKWMPMFNKVDKPDPKFITKMTSDKALEYWIRLLVEAYIRLYQNGKMTECEVVEEYNREYHIENNYMAAFLETLDIDQDVIGKTGPEIKAMYHAYNDDDGRPYKPKLLNDALHEMNIGRGIKKIDGKVYKVFMRQEDTKQKLL